MQVRAIAMPRPLPLVLRSRESSSRRSAVAPDGALR